MASIGAPLTVSAQNLHVTSSAFVPDREFPGLLQYFREGWTLKDEMGQTQQYAQSVRPGAYLQVFVRNTGAEAIPVETVRLNGIDLAEQLAPRHGEHRGLRAAHFLLNDETVTPPELRQKLTALGAPVWWQVRPNPIPPGRFAQVTVRLRSLPTEKRLELAVPAKAGRPATARLSSARPASLAIDYVTCTQERDGLLLYLRGDGSREFSVATVQVDGTQVALAEPAGQSQYGVLPVALELPESLSYGSFHHVAVRTGDSRVAAAVFRAHDPFLSLGMWGYRNDGLTLEDMVRDCAGAYRDHLFNTHMGMAGSHTGYLESTDGLGMLQEMDLRLMAGAPSSDTARSPQLYSRFLLDEPDVSDYYGADQLPAHQRVGSYAQALVERQREWTAKDPRTLTFLNVDMTFKPENWLTYGQLPDIFALDPYYQNRLRSAYWSHPGWLAQFCHPYYIHAVSEIARSACAPHPLHVLLNSTSYREEERSFRYGTPEEKRIEFYYALAAGAKGISYWWFTPYGRHQGCGAAEPEAFAMMQELARLNAEARALAPSLAVACPATTPGQNDPFASAQPAWLWTRTLFAGTDTTIVVLINRDHASDRVGTVYQPIPKAQVTFRVPPWMQGQGAFRLAGGTCEELKLGRGEDGVTVDLRDLALTEIIVISDEPSLQVEVKRRWEGLRPQLDAVTSRTFEEYAAERNRAAEDRAAEVVRRREELFAKYAPYADRLVEASERLGTYGVETDDVWNPTNTRHAAQTWWVARDKVEPDMIKGLRWKPQAPGKYRVAISYVPNHDYRVRLVDREGQILSDKIVPRQFPRHSAVVEWPLETPDGAVLEFVQLGEDTRGEMWGRVSPYAYFLSAEE